MSGRALEKPWKKAFTEKYVFLMSLDEATFATPRTSYGFFGDAADGADAWNDRWKGWSPSIRVATSRPGWVFPPYFRVLNGNNSESMVFWGHNTQRKLRFESVDAVQS